jgi:hypothetical protein
MDNEIAEIELVSTLYDYVLYKIDRNLFSYNKI